jgi:hypothetical protein
LETAFRRHASTIAKPPATDGLAAIAVDGKTLRGSFDAFRDRKAVRGADAARRHIHDLIEYRHANHGALVNYGRRRHDGLPISTAFVESAVNEILSKRMIKKQQMRWNRRTVKPFLNVRTAVLNKCSAARSSGYIQISEPMTKVVPFSSQHDEPHDFACSRNYSMGESDLELPIDTRERRNSLVMKHFK